MNLVPYTTVKENNNLILLSGKKLSVERCVIKDEVFSCSKACILVQYKQLNIDIFIVFK